MADFRYPILFGRSASCARNRRSSEEIFAALFREARYGSRFQSLAGRFDHPHQRSVSENERRTVNLQALKVIWPILIGEREMILSSEIESSLGETYVISGNIKRSTASITMPTRAQIGDRMFDRLLPAAVLSRRRPNTNQTKERVNR